MKYRELLKECQKYNLEYEAFIFLITELSQINRSELIFKLDEEIDPVLLLQIKTAIDKYVKDNIPVQYIIGYTYFYGLKICVNHHVLIPRFDTEEVVEKVIEEASKYHEPTILDLCTGSGAIALAIKKQVRRAKVLATDISDAALEVATLNAYNNSLDVEFKKSDLLRNVEGLYDIIVSNPPYIGKDEVIDKLVYDNEPHLALFSDNNGLYHYEEILKDAKQHLSNNGVIFFEISAFKKKEMIELVLKYFDHYEVYKDLNNNDRIMKIW